MQSTHSSPITINNLALTEINKAWNKLKLKKNFNSVGCWTPLKITAPTKQKGYLQLTHLGKKYLVHHVSWCSSSNSFIPDGMVVSHVCGNPLCCNPQHLEICSKEFNESRKYCHMGLWHIDACPHQTVSGRRKCIVIPVGEPRQ